MRTWVKFTIAGAALLLAAWAVIAGTGAYFVFRHFDTRSATQADTIRDFEEVRARFGSRPALVEIVDLHRGEVRINRLQGAEGKSVDTLHILAWKAEDRELIRTDVPVWLLRFSSVNLLSRLGIGPARLRITVDDIKRYGAGIVVDYGPPGSDHVLLWVD